LELSSGWIFTVKVLENKVRQKAILFPNTFVMAQPAIAISRYFAKSGRQPKSLLLLGTRAQSVKPCL